MINRNGLAAIVASAVLYGCSGADVEIPTSFPVPLVSKIPLTMGLHLNESLTEYVFEQSLQGSGDYRIALGDAQLPMFQTLFTGMFGGVEMVGDPTVPDVAVAGVLSPSISEVQFSTPTQTRSDYFEVWIRYQFDLHGRDGTPLGSWPLTAYGKANVNNYGMSGTEAALTAAALAACRDAMAFFIVQFRTVPAVRDWLSNVLPPAQPPIQPPMQPPMQAPVQQPPMEPPGLPTGQSTESSKT